MEYIRVSAKTVSDAIIEAAIQLGTSSDNIEYEVLETGSSGFFGFGSKPAVIRARRKEPAAEELFEEEIKKEIKEPINVKPYRESRAFRERSREKNRDYNRDYQKESKAPAKEPEKKEKEVREFKESKEVKEVKEVKEIKEPKETKEVKEVRENREPETRKPAAPKPPVNKEEAIARAEDFLGKTLKAMNMNVKITCTFDDDDTLNIDLDGEDMGILIGKRGQTLDSIQYLTSLVVNKGKASYVRVKVDTEDYRRRRKETLENLARNVAAKVRRTRKTVFLEPMNPYERRIIHSALQGNPYVSTHSEGEEPYRKVVVTLKKQQDREQRY
ncbi:MAG: RNA-binding cell elongation regulator Jag/EloR [Eubacteriales bacterium]|nr:RNA-binding cell elongation regulator Jag/EloR [Eubacteriales bacterium]